MLNLGNSGVGLTWTRRAGIPMQMLQAESECECGQLIRCTRSGYRPHRR